MVGCTSMQNNRAELSKPQVSPRQIGSLSELGNYIMPQAFTFLKTRGKVETGEFFLCAWSYFSYRT